MFSQKYIIGIDEAGRGPLAGPVSVAVVALPVKSTERLERLFSSIEGKDSKKLTEKVREECFVVLQQEKKKGNIFIAQSFVAASIIDKKGIVNAVTLGIERSLKKLQIDPQHTKVLLDGSLKAPNQYINQETIIRGDETELTIRLASIIAKVRRDRIMKRLSKRYPGYELEKHKGYGTKVHRDNIKKHGLCSLHRKSFCKRFVLENV